MANLGGPFPTPAPEYTEAADILRALRLYHYGTETIPANESEVDPASVAGYIKNVLDRIDSVEQGVAAISNLTEANDLNQISETKVYHAIPNITTELQTTLNYPTTTTGILISYVARSTRYQFYQTATNPSGTTELYFRSTAYGTNTWTDWQQLSKTGHTHNNLYYTINQVDAKISNSIAANRALVSDNDGKVIASPITNEELGHLDGVTGNIQTQLNTHDHNDLYHQKTETARVFVQSSQPSSSEAAVGDLWIY